MLLDSINRATALAAAAASTDVTTSAETFVIGAIFNPSIAGALDDSQGSESTTTGMTTGCRFNDAIVFMANFEKKTSRYGRLNLQLRLQ